MLGNSVNTLYRRWAAHPEEKTKQKKKKEGVEGFQDLVRTRLRYSFVSACVNLFIYLFHTFGHWTRHTNCLLYRAYTIFVLMFNLFKSKAKLNYARKYLNTSFELSGGTEHTIPVADPAMQGIWKSITLTCCLLLPANRWAGILYEAIVAREEFLFRIRTGPWPGRTVPCRALIKCCIICQNAAIALGKLP